MLTTVARHIFQPQRFSLVYHAALCIATRKHASKCLDLLTSQQKVIHKSLDAFQGWSASIKQEISTPKGITKEEDIGEQMMDDLQHFHTFFQDYVDAIHFQLEEGTFPFIRRYMKHTLIPYHDGIYLPSDHETARHYISQIGSKQLVHDFDTTLHAISEFITFLSVHGQNSVSHLYPEIENKAPGSVMCEMNEYCQQFMAECKDKEGQLLLICDALDAKYNKEGESHTNKPSEFYKRMSYFDDIE
eukprot:CAMPEP_0197056274 /NCGR_PEP_ID=MMETSP1384-20130603/81690_1 /TAXON_ID=29189 /ORGANISM="Ammonia sp." /LENGTH=244 /DNA_ID=CAMNT_0042490189 /DNA_START=56 /DNA_END=790 /DNA_ORIENTATION=-